MRDENTAVYTPSKVALAVLIAAGLTIGVLPLLLYKSLAVLIAPYFLFSLLAALWMGRKFVSHASAPPNRWEWFLAGWNAVGMGATASLIGFIWYGLAYAVVWAVDYLANAVGWEMELVPSTFATYAGGGFFAIFALIVPFLATEQILAELFPAIAGIRSVYYSIAAMRTQIVLIALGCIVGCILVLTVFDLDPVGFWFTLLLTFVFVGTSAPMQKAELSRRPSADGATLLRAVRRLYAAAGYTLIDRPRTNDPELDPLVTEIDLLATAGDRGYAVQTSLAASPESDLDEGTVFEVRAGAKALQRALRAGEPSATRVEPYLFVVGGHISESMQDFCREVGVSLHHVADVGSLRAAVSETDSTALREIALRLLQVPLAEQSEVPAEREQGEVSR